MADAHLLVSHFAPAATHAAGPTQGWDTVAWVVYFLFVAGAIALAVSDVLRARKSDGGDDDDSGPGRGGPEPPRGDPGQSRADPTWWCEFERQFAAYVEDARRTASPMHR